MIHLFKGLTHLKLALKMKLKTLFCKTQIQLCQPNDKTTLSSFLLNFYLRQTLS